MPCCNWNVPRRSEMATFARQLQWAGGTKNSTSFMKGRWFVVTLCGAVSLDRTVRRLSHLDFIFLGGYINWTRRRPIITEKVGGEEDIFFPRENENLNCATGFIYSA